MFSNEHQVYIVKSLHYKRPTAQKSPQQDFVESRDKELSNDV